MAVDEALLHSKSNAPILRLYRWHPATLSLGYFQPLALRDNHPPSAGCPVIRRSSGGGAILHDTEITYSLIMPRLARDRAAEDLYECVHHAVVEWLRTWGMETQALVRRDPRREPFSLFRAALKRRSRCRTS